MLIIVVIGSLYMVTSQLEVASRKYVRDDATFRVLNLAKEALIGYAATYRDTNSGEVFGYLPCPDIDGDGSANGFSEDCGATDSTVRIGLLPFKQLGLPSNTDADGNCLWYAVSGTFKASSNGTYLPRPLNWDTQGQIEIRDSNDALITKPDDQYGGAAAVIFSVGPPQANQSDRLPASDTAPCGFSLASQKADAIYTRYIEVDPSKQNRALSEPFPGPFPVPGPTDAIVRVVQGVAGSNTNNDRLVWITPKEIFDRVKIRSDFKNASSATPAGQINTLIDKVKVALDARITADITSATRNTTVPTPYAASDPETYSSPDRWVGGLPDVTQGSLGEAISTDYVSYFNNWSDHFRYTLCTDLNSYCLSINGVNCDGALFFGGESITGLPRSSIQRQLSNYFESALSLLTGGTISFSSANTAYSDSNRSADLGYCLAPPVTSFANNIGQFQTSGSGANVISIDTVGKVIDLGQLYAGSSVAGAGCAWYPTPMAFASGLRAYFRYNIANKGQGFTFALADANAVRNSSTAMCGGTGSYLGYANGSIHPPKIGFEFDTSSNSSRNDPSSNHVGILYWGTTASASDDNTHGVGAGSGSEPVNPSKTSAGVSTFTMNIGDNIDVRIDITRNYDTSTQKGSYNLKVYMAASFPDCTRTDFQNLTQDLSALCPQPIEVSDSIVLDNPTDGGGEAMRTVYFGFTNAQSFSGDQQITISDFQIRNR
ncbi:MAG: hypothetical protein PHQ05_00490 [Sterolibacterium sp.]|nr:hypothetical protein [Sterolibacterium sp.]